MNETYFQLPINKQKNLINSGYKVFALYPYKKASMLAIANEANISKSLLFYYFKDKKEYYLYLFDTAIAFLDEQRETPNLNIKYDFFELINKTIEHRMHMIDAYPYLYKFIANAYYEDLEEIKPVLDNRKKVMLQSEKVAFLKVVDHEKFKEPSDAELLFDIVLATAEGCMIGIEDLDANKMQVQINTFKRMMQSLEKHYYKAD